MQTSEIPRQSDGTAFFLHFTGGFRAANIGPDAWKVEPVLSDGKPCVKGPVTTSEMNVLAKQNGIRAVAFHRIGWMDGQYHSTWAPVVPGKKNHSEGPSELWANIASNIARSRTKKFFDEIKEPSEAEIASIFDNREPDEALASYISLSLRSMDISVEQVAEYYHEQLVNHMAAGNVDGERSDNTLSQSLRAHVHSFFLHLGAARDYLGALIAYRVGFDHKKTDSMARLLEELRFAKAPKDALFDLMISSGNISQHPIKPSRFSAAGWMDEATALRNELVHKRPYGAKFNEGLGWAEATSKGSGLYRYFRPVELDGNAKKDIFDVIHFHYSKCMDLFLQAAKATGNDTTMIHITSEDVISIKVPTPDAGD